MNSRNKLYIQKNKYTVRLYEHHRNYRIVVGDEETKYYYFITEMDDISYPNMFVISLKVDEKHSNDTKEYAFNEYDIDFSDLYNDKGIDVKAPIIYCESYYNVNDEFVIRCSNIITNIEFNNLCLSIKSIEENGDYVIVANETGLCQVTVTDAYGATVSKNIVIK